MPAPRPRFFCALPGGASHAATIAGGAIALDDEGDVVGWSGVSAGFLIALLGAFGRLKEAPFLLERMLQNNRVLDIGGVDGDLGLCEWNVIPQLVDDVLGKGVTMGQAITPLVGVVTNADTGRPLYISKRDHPDVLVRDVARATSALVPLASLVPIPSLGTAVSPDVRLFFDGGFVDNLPDHVFAEHREPTVSLSLVPDVDDIVRVRPFQQDAKAALHQAIAVARSITYAQAQRKNPRSDGAHVAIKAFGSGLNFDLSPESTLQRVSNGHAQVMQAIDAGLLHGFPTTP